MRTWKDKVMTYDVIEINSEEYEMKDGLQRYNVNMETQTCICGKYQAWRLSCTHARKQDNH